MCPAFLAMVRSQAAERLKEWQVSSFGNDVLILRDPNETQEAGKNIKAFYMRNAESKFQRATREAFHEYRKMLKDKGVKHLRFMCIIAAPEGVKHLQEAHPDVDIYVGALDDHLNENGYIVPGLGDAGDRIFGTK